MKYYLHDSSAFEDEKITELYLKFGYEGLGLFYTVLEKLAKQEKPVKTTVLKAQLKVGKKLSKCWEFMESLGLLSSNNGDTFNKQLLNFSEKYQIKKQKTREKVAEWRKNQEDSENVTDYVPICNQPKVKESKVNESKEKKEIAETISPPYQSENFILLWNEFLKMPKQKKKPLTAISLMAKQLKKYNEEFAVQLVEKAIAGNYQGVVFGDTDQKFETFKNGTKKNIRGITGQTLRGVEFGEF